MKKFRSLAVGCLMALGVSLGTIEADAQVYADFDLELRENTPYVTLVNGMTGMTSLTVLAPSEFWIPPTRIPNRDDGYKEVDLPFTFKYNGVDYNRIYVSVNGFITFNNPPNVIADDPKALFTIENSYADNVVAPFWGDHYYRSSADNTGGAGTNQYAPTTIQVGKFDDRVVVEWKDLNILDKTITSSIATFQVIIYKSTDPNSTQGSIEFAYGTSGRKPNQQTSETQVITSGATIGIKGDLGTIHSTADYMNALKYAEEKSIQISSKVLSEQWQPTSGSEKRFLFVPHIRHTIPLGWGDGDADMSRVVGQKHYNFPTTQNRFVTVSDAREIMVSIAYNQPLDSIKGRAAYHGDVNHNGRFIYTVDNEKYEIPTRSKEFNQDLPLSLIGNERQIMFQVTENDAALILHYLAARVPYLPWLENDFPLYGKSNEEAIAFGSIENLGNGLYNIPVYASRDSKGALGLKFDVDAEIVDITDLSNGSIMNVYNNNTAVLSGSGEFEQGTPICYVTLKSNNDNLNISNIRLNDENQNNMTISLKEVENTDLSQSLLNSPNPFNNNTVISVYIENEGVYNLSIYDSKGNLVKAFENQKLSSGYASFNWDATDMNNAKVNQGMYIYRLTGNGVNMSNQMVIIK